MKELLIMVRIDNLGKIKSAVVTKGFPKGNEKKLLISGVYDYLKEREMQKLYADKLEAKDG